MTPNLQERLNGITEVLSRVSKLVTEDLEKAVSAVVGQDKQGRWSSPDNQSSDRPIYRPADILLLLRFFMFILFFCLDLQMDSSINAIFLN